MVFRDIVDRFINVRAMVHNETDPVPEDAFDIKMDYDIRGANEFITTMRQ